MDWIGVPLTRLRTATSNAAMINFTRALGRASAHRRMTVLPPCCRSRRRTICWYTLRTGARMTTPLDPVIAQIIPLLPLRDPKTMTPQSARDQLRALAATRAAIPPPPVRRASHTEVKGAAGPLAARVYRVSDEKSPTVAYFHGGGWFAGDLETHDRQARLLAIETVVVSVDYRRPPETRFPGAFEDAFAAVRDVVARIA